jgi:hypothetical protein
MDLLTVDENIVLLLGPLHGASDLIVEFDLWVDYLLPAADHFLAGRAELAAEVVPVVLLVFEHAVFEVLVVFEGPGF